MKILIISTNALGDTYMSAAAIAPLRSHFQNKCEIHLLYLSKTANADLLVDGLDIDKRWRLPDKSLKSILKCYLDVKKIKYGYVFSFFPGRINTFFLFMVRAKVRIGYPNFKKIIEWYGISQNIYSSTQSKVKSAWLPTMTYMERIGLCLTAGEIYYDDLRKPFLQTIPIEKITSSSFILLHLASRWKDRSLSFQSQCELISFLSDHYNDPIIVLGWEDEATLLKQCFISNKNISFVEDANLTTLVNYIILSKYFITIDSFPMHIADAYETNFIGIFGPTYPKAFQACSKSVVFSCNDLSKINAKDVIKGIKNYIN